MGLLMLVFKCRLRYYRRIRARAAPDTDSSRLSTQMRGKGARSLKKCSGRSAGGQVLVPPCFPLEKRRRISIGPAAPEPAGGGRNFYADNLRGRTHGPTSSHAAPPSKVRSREHRIAGKSNCLRIARRSALKRSTGEPNLSHGRRLSRAFSLLNIVSVMRRPRAPR